MSVSSASLERLPNMKFTPCLVPCEGEHCWHLEHSNQSPPPVVGVDQVVCCYCGHRERFSWQAEPDDCHGPFVNVPLHKVYDDEGMKEPRWTTR